MFNFLNVNMMHAKHYFTRNHIFENDGTYLSSPAYGRLRQRNLKVDVDFAYPQNTVINNLMSRESSLKNNDIWSDLKLKPVCWQRQRQEGFDRKGEGEASLGYIIYSRPVLETH